MKLGEATGKLLSQHNSLVMIMNAALGDGKGGSGKKPVTVHDPGVKDMAAGHADLDSAVAAINAMMTI